MSGPLRFLAVSTFVNTVGGGLWTACSIVYLLQVADVDAGEIAIVTAVAALVGAACGVPLGKLSDRLGPRQVSVALLAAEAAAVLGYLLVRGPVGYLLVTTALAALERGGSAARGAMLASCFTPSERTRSRALVRSAQNLGTAFGAAAAGLALGLHSLLAFHIAIVVDALTYLAAAVLTARMPAIPGRPERSGQRTRVAVRDRPYLLVSGVNAALFLHYPLLNVVLPVWALEHTRAPAWVVGATLLLNTVMVVLLQVRASRGSEHVERASALLRHTGVAVAVACMVFAATAGASAPGAVIGLLAGVAVYTLAELWHSAASFSLSCELAPAHAQGEYQAAFGAWIGVARVVAPPVLIFLVTDLEAVGWLLLGLLFCLLGVMARHIVPQAAAVIRTREGAAAHIGSGDGPT